MVVRPRSDMVLRRDGRRKEEDARSRADRNRQLESCSFEMPSNSSANIECVHCGHLFSTSSLHRHLKQVMSPDSEDASDDSEGDDSAAMDWSAEPPHFEDEPFFDADMTGRDEDALLGKRPEWAADSDAESESESEADGPEEGGDGASDAFDDLDEDVLGFRELYKRLLEAEEMLGELGDDMDTGE